MLQKKIEEELRNSLKSRDTEKASTLRLLVSQIKNARIEKKADLTDEEVLGIIKREIKGRDEAVELYKKGGREDLVKKEESEKVILQKYLAYRPCLPTGRQAGLPKELSEEEIGKAIDEVLGKAGESPNFGQVMGRVMEKLKGKAGGKRVSQLVKERLRM